MRSASPARPGFVIFGAETGEGGVVVIASTDLVDAELELRCDVRGDPFGRDNGLHRDEYTLRTRMLRYTAVFGSDYADALARLLSSWQPPGAAAELAVRMPRALPCA